MQNTSMRFPKIFIPESQAKHAGLQEIDLTKKSLGSTVALIGRNGAGKSRILKFIENNLQNLDAQKYFQGSVTHIPDIVNVGPFLQQITHAKSYYNQLLDSRLDEHSRRQLISNLNSQSNGFLQRLQQLGSAYIKVVDNDDLKTIRDNINNNGLSFEQILSNVHFDNIQGNPAIIPNALANPQQHTNVLVNEFMAFNNKATINYLVNLTTEIITDEIGLYVNNRETPERVKEEIKNKKSFQLFDKFQGYVQQFLGKSFTYKQHTVRNTVNTTLHFDDKPFDLTQFSPGQKTLFAYAVLFFYLDINTKANIRESIIIIDEPEKHLHPEAQIILINALKNIINEKGQLWIATHSVHILSHLEYDEIIMVKDNGIILPSRTTPGETFTDLMGLEEHVHELNTFINSVSEWAYANFLAQCFSSPEVIFNKNVNDPQFILFKKFLEEKHEIKILDYGAGKGRLGHTIKEDREMTKVNYYAYEPNEEMKEFLLPLLHDNNVYTYSSDIPTGFFDCVVLCNVLHEISPLEWLAELELIKSVLKDDGYLLIIEDRFLPKGENANEFGYLILGTDEQQALLNTNISINLKLSNPAYSERIIFNAFPKSQILPNQTSILTAIKLLSTNCFQNIKTLRAANRDNKDVNHGRKYANETQLYINSKLAIDSISSMLS